MKEGKIYFIPHEVSLIDKAPQSTTFVETYIFEPSQKEEGLGSLYIVGQIYSTLKRKYNAELLSNFVETVKTEYFSNPNKEPSDAFKLALKRGNLFLESSRGLFLKSALKINMSIVALAHGKIYATRLTEGVVFVVRNNEINPIESVQKYSSQKRSPRFLDIYRGNVLNGDIIALTTPQIYKAGKGKLGQILVGPSTYLLKEKESFKNIGLITVRVRSRGAKNKTISKKQPNVLSKAVSERSQLKKQLEKNRKLKTFFIFLGITLVVVAVTASAVSIQRVSGEKERLAKGIITSIESLKERTETLLGLDNYSEAEIALLEWQEKLEELKLLEVLKEKTKEEEEFLDEYSALVLRYERINGAQEIINLSNNSIGFKPEGFIKSKDGFVLFSKDTFYNFNSITQTGSFSVLPGLSSSGKEIFNFSRDIYLNPDNPEEIFVLTQNSILSYKNDRLETIIEDEKLIASLKINVFNDAIYVLSPSNIWRVNLENQVLTTWLESGLSLDNARDFTIDGFIYVLDESGVSKFLSGRKNSDISDLKDITRLTTRSGLKNIYYLGSQRSVLIIADKFGNVSRRITNERLTGAISIIIDDSEKTLYILQGERVFSLSF